MDMITITLDGDDYEFPAYRSMDLLESFEDYMVGCLLGVYVEARPDIITTRCLLSGFQVATLVSVEVEQMIRQAVLANQLERFESIIPLPEAMHDEAFQAVWNHIHARMIDTAKVAPSVSFSRDRLALAHQPWNRQLTILLGNLLFDAGMLRDKSMDYATRHARIIATRDLADMVQLIDSFDMVDELHAALIELDAKYAIRTLQFTRKEQAKIEAFRAAEYIDFDSMLPFILELINYRDQTTAVVEDDSGAITWSREVFRQRTFEAIDRIAHSNVFRPLVVGGKPKQAVNRDGTKVKDGNPVGRPKKVLTPEQQAEADLKAERKSAAASAFDSIFAGVNFGNLGKK